MHPAIYAKTDPDRAAFIMAGSGETVTYRQLEERSNQGAHLFRSLGLKAGDGVALFMDNHPRFLEIAWAAQRCGLYYTCISAKLSAGEVEYIVGDCGAQMLIASPGVSATIDELPGVLSGVKLYIDAGVPPRSLTLGLCPILVQRTKLGRISDFKMISCLYLARS